MTQVPTAFKIAARSLHFLCAAVVLTGCPCIPVRQGVFQSADKKTDHFVPNKNLKPGEFFTTELKTTAKTFSDAGQIQAANSNVDKDYRLGPGDHFAFLVRHFPDISQEDIIVSPDGLVALPRVGIINVKGLTLQQVTDQSVTALKKYYEIPDVTLVMKAFNNNKVYVLGRVANPGAVSFQGPGTLLEALSLSGGMPADINKTFLSRCSITRGKNMVMWIDLRELLERGNMNLNARLQNGDVIFIPMSEDQNAYVLGEVKVPGAIQLRTQMNVMNAIMACGGPNKEANLSDVFLIHQAQGKGMVERINIAELVGKGNGTKNYILRDGDMIYVPENGLSKFNYICQQITPFFNIVGVFINGVTGLGLLNSSLLGASISGTSTSSSGATTTSTGTVTH